MDMPDRLLTAVATATIEALGSAPDDDDFQRALRIAVADGLVIAPAIEHRGRKKPGRDDDELRARTADVILQSHPLVRMSGQVEEFVARITDSVKEIGAMTIHELRGAVVIDKTADDDTVVAFEAGVAQALAEGQIIWLPQSEHTRIDGLFFQPSLGRLGASALYAIPRDAVERDWPSPPSAPEATRRLRDALSALKTDVATVRAASAARKARGRGQSASGLGGRRNPQRELMRRR